jgi:hypothetical protein
LKENQKKFSGYRQPMKQRGKGERQVNVKNGDGKVMDKGTWNHRVMGQEVEERIK